MLPMHPISCRVAQAVGRYHTDPGILQVAPGFFIQLTEIYEF